MAFIVSRNSSPDLDGVEAGLREQAPEGASPKL